MPNPYFCFKQFTVFHHLCAMKVGIDGVLLGAWACVDKASNILDIGCGSGLISLMLAQRCNAELTAIDIEPSAVRQTLENAANSPWKERFIVREIALQKFALQDNPKYELIICNPPFFVNSLKTLDKERTTARHADTLSHEDLMICSKKLMHQSGRICLILPVNEGVKCKEFAESIGLFCNKLVQVYPKPLTEAKRILLEFSLVESAIEILDLTIESEIRHAYSKEFSELVKDFYLKL